MPRRPRVATLVVIWRQDGDGRRGKDWWYLPDLSRRTHALTVLRVEPHLHKIPVSSGKGPMSGRHT